MRIAEIYTSVQGEGIWTGTPSVFVRVSGCNLRCWFCDTPYASWQPEGESFTAAEVFQQIESMIPDLDTGEGPPHVVLTGGEPFVFPELVALTARLANKGYKITIETAGTLYRPVKCDLMSISPKLANSTPQSAGRWQDQHEATRYQPGVIDQLLQQYFCQLKFVIQLETDLAEVQQFVDCHPLDASRVLLMPQGTSLEELSVVTEWLEPKCRELGWQFCPRKHIEWFGGGRGV